MPKKTKRQKQQADRRRHFTPVTVPHQTSSPAQLNQPAFVYNAPTTAMAPPTDVSGQYRAIRKDLVKTCIISTCIIAGQIALSRLML